MDRRWLASYPPGIPAEVNVHAFASLNALFESACAQFADRPAFTFLGGHLAYGELHALAHAFARSLRQRHGLVPGQRLAVMLPNSLQYPVVVYGALLAGLEVVNCNPMYTAPELAFQLKDSQASAVVVLENFAHTVELAAPDTDLRLTIITQLGDLLPGWRRVMVNFATRHRMPSPPVHAVPGPVRLLDLLDEGRRLPQRDVAVTAADIAFVQYTGGTTGRPKGALLTHGGLAANVEQTIAWLGGALVPGREIVITALPLYHVFALLANLLVFTRLGAENVLVPDARNLPALVRLLQRTPFTALTGVNTLFDALLATPGFMLAAARRHGRVKIVVAGGMPVNRRVAEAWRAALGASLVEGYGLTEASPIVCANPVAGAAFTGMLGLPLPSTDVKLVDEHGAEVALGEVGEICVRGPQVMKGYLGQPEESARVLGADGWLHTGDLGRMDARGYVEFVDRLKDVIVVSGFKAFPAEIEEVARGMPGVKEAGAIGLPDPRTGEAVALFVVASDPQLTVEQVRAHCEARLVAYKRPRHIELCASLPMSPVGKVLRRQLRPGAGADPATAPATAAEAAPHA